MSNAAMPLPGWRGGDGDAAYLDKTLRHHSIELSFDDSVSWRTIRERWFIAAVPAVVFLMLFAIIGIGGDYTLIGTGFLGSVVIFWVIFLFSKCEEPVGEWRVLLADRAPAAASVYSAVSGQLEVRHLPIQHAQRRRFATGFGQLSNRLILVDGHYEAYVSVFEYGTSLYLGWMMWRSRRGFTLLGRYAIDLVAGLVGQLDPVGVMLRTERPRAMREAIHAICREGLHVAIERIEVPEQYGFPQGLPPIESLSNSAAPPPISGPVDRQRMRVEP